MPSSGPSLQSYHIIVAEVVTGMEHGGNVKVQYMVASVCISCNAVKFMFDFATYLTHQQSQHD